MLKKILFFFTFFICLVFSFHTNAAERGHVKPSISVQDYYNHILQAMEKEHWKNLLKEGKEMLTLFPASPYTPEVQYYVGIAYFKQGDYELADRFFSDYLKTERGAKYFEEALGYKFAIAQKFVEGAKRHLMGWERLPKWLSAKEMSIKIFDEIVASLPRHDLAAKSLFYKAKLLFELKEYKPALEVFQTLIRRFPRHFLAPEGYLGIAKIFLEQCQKEFPDPDFLDLAEINLRKFKQDFPTESRVVTAEQLLDQMRDKFAKDLYEIGKFYERTKKPKSAVIYYNTIFKKYPNSRYLAKSKKRLIALNEKIPSFSAPPTQNLKPEGILVEATEQGEKEVVKP